MQGTFWQISKWTFFVLILLVAIGVAAAVFLPSFPLNQAGCYWTNAMIVYIECSNLPYGRAIAFALNLPNWVFAYAWMIGLSSIWKVNIGGILFGLIDIAVLFLGAAYPVGWLLGKTKAKPR